MNGLATATPDWLIRISAEGSQLQEFDFEQAISKWLLNVIEDLKFGKCYGTCHDQIYSNNEFTIISKGAIM